MAKKLSYSQRSKCQGCHALCFNKDSFTCSLEVPVEFSTIDNKAVSPRPKEGNKCYKPKNVQDLRTVRKILKERQKAKP